MNDRSIALALLAAIALLGGAFSVHVVRRGLPRFARVDAIGGSALLGKALIAWWYWALQPVARTLAYALSANVVSYASLGFGVASAVAVGAGKLGLAALLALVAGLCDAVDGMVARIRGEACDAGEVLDAAIDRYTDFFFLAGMAVLYRQDLLALLIVLGAVLGSFMISYSTAKAEALSVQAPRGMMRRHERSAYLLLGTVLAAAFGPQLLARGVAPGLPLIVAAAAIAVVANVSAVRRLITIAERVREKTAIAAAAEAE